MSKNNLHDRRMDEYNLHHEYELSLPIFNEALKRLSSKNANKYSFILNGGQSLVDALFHLFQSVWSSEKIPEGWKKTSIVQLYKGKGANNELSNYRNIHTKEDTRKLFGEIVTHELKQKIPEGLSTFQI